MTLAEEATVTQADRDAAEKFGNAWRMNSAGKFGLANILAAHRQAALLEGARMMQEAAAKVFDENLLQQAARLDVHATMVDSPGAWMHRVRKAAIRALSSEEVVKT